MLTVGTDTYITIAQADVMLSSSLPDATDWTTLPTPRKEQLLKNALYRMDTLPYASYKTSLHQELQFPRGLKKTVPERVMLAQAMEAYAALDSQATERQKLQDQGVTAISLGKASESYDRTQAAYTGALWSREAYNLLRPYLLGSAAIV